MSPLKKILLSNLIYLLLFTAATILFLWPEDAGKGDPAGRAMMDGFFMLIGLAFLLVLAIAFAIYNLKIAIEAKKTYLKFLAIVPILIPLFVFGYSYLGVGQNYEPEIETQVQSHTIEI